MNYFIDWAAHATRELFPGIRITVVSGEKLMLSRVELDAGAVVPEHHHPHEQYGMVLEGDASFTIGGEVRRLSRGDYYAIPGGVLHRVDSGATGAVCLSR